MRTWLILPILLGTSLLACGQDRAKSDEKADQDDDDDDSPKSKKKKKKPKGEKGGPSANPDGTATQKASATATATASSSATPPSTETLTKEEFCARAVEIGEANMEKCAKSEKANVPAMANVKDLSTAKKECSARVDSAKVEFHGDVAHRCIEAAKARGGKTTFFSFDLIPACKGVVTGKVAAGQPALYAEECAPGLAMRKNRCVEPAAKNAACEDYPAGLLGKLEDHPRCQSGLGCFMTKYSADGLPAEFMCLEPREAGAPCKLDLNTCGEGTSCYQGKCRAVAGAGGECMNASHCQAGLACNIRGGAFGTCSDKPEALETCGPKK